MDLITLAAAKAYTDKKAFGGGSTDGGVKSWNDLEDKPFGEEVVSLGDTLTWDGTPTDTSFPVGDLVFYHVSDKTPTAAELLGGVVNVVLFNETKNFEINENYMTVTADGISVVAEGTPVILIYNSEGAYGEIVVPKKGVYFVSGTLLGGYCYTSSLTITGYNFTKTTTHKIDKKYLPDDIGGGLPVVNITVDHLLSLEGAALTAEECAALDAAALLRMPIIAAITNPTTDINPYAFIAESLSFVDSEGVVAFVSTNHVIQMVAPGTWMLVSLPTS